MLLRNNNVGKPLIVILTREIDNSVDQVINWLNFIGTYRIIRITNNRKIKIKRIVLNNNEIDLMLNIDNNELSIKEVYSFWVRNGYFSHDYIFESNDIILQEKVNKFLNSEWKYLNDYFIFLLSKKFKCIGNYKELLPNKLIQLYYAKKVGLSIPNTNIVSGSGVYINKGSIITKPIKDIFTFEKNKIGLATKTKVVSDFKDQVNFFPSLIQSRIDKNFELRIYFFKNKFYAAAIFTGMNSEVDYRSQANKEKLRIVPYLIPRKIKNKLKKLMYLLKIESGSIDMIVSKNMQYYYLEVNPVGYFDNISSVCNFNIEKDIALYLAKK